MSKKEWSKPKLRQLSVLMTAVTFNQWFDNFMNWLNDYAAQYQHFPTLDEIHKWVDKNPCTCSL